MYLIFFCQHIPIYRHLFLLTFIHVLSLFRLNIDLRIDLYQCYCTFHCRAYVLWHLMFVLRSFHVHVFSILIFAFTNINICIAFFSCHEKVSFATSRLLKIIGLFCKKSPIKETIFCKSNICIAFFSRKRTCESTFAKPWRVACHLFSLIYIHILNSKWDAGNTCSAVLRDTTCFLSMFLFCYLLSRISTRYFFQI